MAPRAVATSRPSRGVPAIRCEAGCPSVLIGAGKSGEYDLRIAVRFHVRETGHAVTVAVTEETRYEAAGGTGA
jgi:hypothetical protein